MRSLVFRAGTTACSTSNSRTLKSSSSNASLQTPHCISLCVAVCRSAATNGAAFSSTSVSLGILKYVRSMYISYKPSFPAFPLHFLVFFLFALLQLLLSFSILFFSFLLYPPFFAFVFHSFFIFIVHPSFLCSFVVALYLASTGIFTLSF